MGKWCHVLSSFFLFILARESVAAFHSLPPNLGTTVLSDTVPLSFAPGPIRLRDFIVEWVSAPLPGVAFDLVPGSQEWVRVSDVFVLPRARFRIQVQGVQPGAITNSGFTQALAIDEDMSAAEIPIPLISGEKNTIEIRLRNQKGEEVKGLLALRYRPREAPESLAEDRIFVDESCSKFKVLPRDVKISPDQWMYIGCRLVWVRSDEHAAASLEVFVFWDNVGQVIQVSDITTPATSVSVWPLRLRSQPGNVKLKAKDSQLVLDYSIPDRMHRAFIGLGLGPYSYTIEGGGLDPVHSITPVATLYGSFFFTENNRLVFFDATSINRRFFTDFGIWFNNESVRLFDNRLSLNLMLGGHVIGFQAKDNQYFARFGAPQGAELVLRDVMFKNTSFALGGFVYPPISGKAYYNFWFRWGSPSFFAEFNYIGWRERIDAADDLSRVYSRSVGISVGMPLIRFL